MPGIQISEDQKRRLLELTLTSPVLVRRRAKLILAYAEGKPTMQAAISAGISRGRARYWKRQFLAKGMGIFNLTSTNQEPDEKIEEKLDEPDAEIMQAIDAVRDVNEDIQNNEIPFPEVRKSIGIEINDSLAMAGKRVWLYHLALMLSHEEGTLLGENEEELHDMRVATRRMRTAFEIFGEAFDPKLMKRFEKGLRKLGRALGQVRDMDVILANGIKYQQKIAQKDRAELEPILTSWRDDIAAKRSKLVKHLQSESYQRFKSEFNRFLQAPEDNRLSGKIGIDHNALIRDIVPVLIYNRYARVRAFDNNIPSASITQLHELRIEFKKFRYTLEYFKEILGEGTDDLIDEIKGYQDHLGELHDADVACILVRTYLKDWEKKQAEIPIVERNNPETIVTYLARLHDDRYRMMITFPEVWRKFNRPQVRQKMAQAISLL